MLALLHFTPLWLSVEITAVWRTSVPRLIECLIPDKKGFRLYNTVSPFFFPTICCCASYKNMSGTAVGSRWSMDATVGVCSPTYVRECLQTNKSKEGLAGTGSFVTAAPRVLSLVAAGEC